MTTVKNGKGTGSLDRRGYLGSGGSGNPLGGGGGIGSLGSGTGGRVLGGGSGGGSSLGCTGM